MESAEGTAPASSATPVASPSPAPSDTARPSPTPSATATAVPTRTVRSAGASSAAPAGAASERQETEAPYVFDPDAGPPLIALDAGHGGEDLGARYFDSRGRMVIHESAVVLDLVQRLAVLLRARGYRVLLTRAEDSEVNTAGVDVNGNGEIDYVDDLQARIDMVNAAGADLLLSIHLNAFEWPDGSPAGDVGGTATFYSANRSFSAQSQRLAELVQQDVLEAFYAVGYDIMDRGALADSELEVPDALGSHLILLGPKAPRIVRPSQMPGVLSEPAFITDDREAKLLQDSAMLERLAQAYAHAIDTYFQELGVIDMAAP